MTSKPIQSKILKYFKEHNIYAFKVVVANLSGIPDVIACIDGKFFAFEIKETDKDRPTQLQYYKIRKIEESGGKGFIVRSFDQFINIIKEENL